MCRGSVCSIGLTLVILNSGGEKRGNYVALSVKFFITELKNNVQIKGAVRKLLDM